MMYGVWQPRPAATRTGEIAGMHTVAELADMMEVTVYESGQMNDAVGACTAWLKADPAGYEDFSSRVHVSSMDLAHLLAAAQSAVDWTPSALRSVTPLIGSQYSDLIAWRTRFRDLDREFRANPHGCAPPDYSKMPQPKAPDPDLAILHGTQAVTQPIDRGIAAASALVQSRTPYVVLGVVGTLALLALVRRRS
jgi:hypothetical protein